MRVDVMRVDVMQVDVMQVDVMQVHELLTKGSVECEHPNLYQ